MNRILVLLFSLALFIQSNATHITHYYMRYQYIGPSGSGQEYKILFEAVRDCAASTVQFDPAVTIGFYKASDSSLVNTLHLTKNSETNLESVTDNGPPLCIRRATYESTVVLATSAKGYYAFYMRCCRTDNDNIVADAGTTLICFIPPTSTTNSSPQINDIRFIAIPANTVYKLDLSMSDADQDTLTYSWIRPYGGASSTDPNPFDEPQSISGIPAKFGKINALLYINGYSTGSPFGAGGWAILDSANGRAKLFSPHAGRYFLALQFKEWRNGKIFNITQRDVFVVFYNSPFPLSDVFLSAQAGENKSAHITWNDTFSDVSSYELERKISTGSWSTLAVCDSNTLSYTDTGLQFDISYYYRVTAHRAVGKTSVSNVDTVIHHKSSTGVAIPARTFINIYPNPTDGFISIVADKIPKSIEITDLTGKVINTFTEPEMNVSALAPGVYFVRCYFNDGAAIAKFIKE